MKEDARTSEAHEIERVKREDAEGRILALERTLARLERDNRLLSIASENAERLRRSHEAELTKVKERAEAAALSKGNFLANMSHEIRTPMNAIKGLSELLMLTDLSRSQQNYVSNIIGSSNSLLKIINDVLDFSKIDAGRMEMLESPYELTGLFAELVSTLNVRCREKDLILVTDIDPNLPGRLKGDDVRIKQVLSNLLSNAIKYTRKGSVVLSLRGERLPEADGRRDIRLIFSVRDTGIGIRQEDMDELFEAFSRADLQKNRAIIGTGLGLAITKRLVQAMGGEVSLSSVYGEGSDFSFWVQQEVVDETAIAQVRDPGSLRALVLGGGLRSDYEMKMLAALLVPAVRCPDEADLESALADGCTHCIYHEDESLEIVRRNRGKFPEGCCLVAVRDIRCTSEESCGEHRVVFEPMLVTNLAHALDREAETGTAASEASAARVRTRGVCALLVDDNEINLMVGGEILSSYDIRADSAASGMEALLKCSETKYDIIFMDQMMPEMDGIETTQRIRGEDGLNARTPIVALTANVMNDVRDTLIGSGMDDFIGKPIEIPELNRILRKWLPEKKQLPD